MTPCVVVVGGGGGVWGSIMQNCPIVTFYTLPPLDMYDSDVVDPPKSSGYGPSKGAIGYSLRYKTYLEPEVCAFWSYFCGLVDILQNGSVSKNCQEERGLVVNLSNTGICM